jgi:hypothetical protein
MAPGISDISLTQLSTFIAAHMGLHFPRERWRDLEREISFAAREGDATALALLARLYANQGKLAEALKWCGQAIAADQLNPGYRGETRMPSVIVDTDVVSFLFVSGHDSSLEHQFHFPRSRSRSGSSRFSKRLMRSAASTRRRRSWPT